MSFSTLWHTMTILPSVPAPGTKHLATTSSADLEPNLPSWERHPAGRTNREAGHLDAQWIHAHLP